MQSGPYTPILETVVTARPIVDYLANITDCQENLISCLRNLSADDLMAASLQTNTIFKCPLSTIWLPIVDGDMIKYQLHESIQKERFRKIPLMINTNKDEATFFITELIHSPSDISVIKSKSFSFLNSFEMVLIFNSNPSQNWNYIIQMLIPHMNIIIFLLHSRISILIVQIENLLKHTLAPAFQSTDRYLTIF
jgi:hypothetical protein